ADEPVHERGFSGVRTAYDSNKSGLKFLWHSDMIPRGTCKYSNRPARIALISGSLFFVFEAKFPTFICSSIPSVYIDSDWSIACEIRKSIRSSGRWTNRFHGAE